VVVCLALVASAESLEAQQTVQQTLSISATFADRVKVAFDRTTVALDTEAYDPDTVVEIAAAPLTVTAKARVLGNARTVLTVRADGPLRSGADTIPINKLTWRMTGAGFMNTGTANDNAARTLGSWRGSGVWTGSQTYLFDDSWSYPVGSYSVVMTYTLTVP
jgi:hypothetical protein